MSMLIRGGHLIDPEAGRDGIYDILVKDGVIAEFAEWIQGESPVWEDGIADEVINAEGKYVMPGFIDLHVHLREPGLEYKETIATGRAIFESSVSFSQVHGYFGGKRDILKRGTSRKGG